MKRNGTIWTWFCHCVRINCFADAFESELGELMSGSTLTNWTNWKAVAGVLAVLVFVIAQLFLVVHAAKYGDGPHDHGGQACVLSLAAPADDKFVATGTLVIAAIFMFWRVSNHIAQTERAHILVRASRPRGPPNR